eukprot:g26291.t1
MSSLDTLQFEVLERVGGKMVIKSDEHRFWTTQGGSITEDYQSLREKHLALIGSAGADAATRQVVEASEEQEQPEPLPSTSENEEKESLAKLEESPGLELKVASEISGVDLILGKDKSLWLYSSSADKMIGKHVQIGGFGTGQYVPAEGEEGLEFKLPQGDKTLIQLDETSWKQDGSGTSVISLFKLLLMCENEKNITDHKISYLNVKRKDDANLESGMDGFEVSYKNHMRFKCVLFLLGGEEFPNLALEQLSAAKQLEPGAMRQSFVRRQYSCVGWLSKLGLVPDLPTCPNCGMTPMMGQRHQRPSPQNLCQAWVQPDYLSIFDPEVRGKFEASSDSRSRESWELQRLRLWHRPNVLDSREEVKNWVKKVSTSDRAWYNDNYVSSEPNKREWRFSQLITEGKVKRLLDAGAGSCTLESWKEQERGNFTGTLRRQRLLSKLDVYLAFGAYDCSMLRICAERGALSFQQNWLKQMPICASCKFDLIFQVEGLHHNKDVEAHGLFLQKLGLRDFGPTGSSTQSTLSAANLAGDRS